MAGARVRKTLFQILQIPGWLLSLSTNADHQLTDMKLNNSKIVASLISVSAILMVLAGCASSPPNKRNTSLSKEQILQQSDVKGHPPVVFSKNLDEVRQAGLRALTFVGCEIKRQEALFLSGRRPSKFGLFVGSGGETVKVFLYPESDNETHVWVDTDKSFVGIAGQQGWNKQVIEEMTKILSEPAPAK